jgi:16S rRNA (cytidine1402-2'-O)-methyltransferase
VVVRELTKKFEEILRGEVSELITHFKKHTPKGEFVIIVKGYEEVEAEEIENDEQD